MFCKFVRPLCDKLDKNEISTVEFLQQILNQLDEEYCIEDAGSALVITEKENDYDKGLRFLSGMYSGANNVHEMLSKQAAAAFLRSEDEKANLLRRAASDIDQVHNIIKKIEADHRNGWPQTENEIRLLNRKKK